MRPFQTLYSRTHFTDLITTKFPQIPKIYRGFHSTNNLFLSESSTVSTTYDPVSDRLVTTRVSNSKHSESESDKRADRSSNSDYADALKDDRSYGSVLKSNQGFGVGKKKSKSKSTWVYKSCLVGLPKGGNILEAVDGITVYPVLGLVQSFTPPAHSKTVVGL